MLERAICLAGDKMHSCVDGTWLWMDSLAAGLQSESQTGRRPAPKAVAYRLSMQRFIGAHNG